MILVYTGAGKGKTCASVGQAIRAHGQGMKVCFAQFMKRPDQAGEQRMLAKMLGDGFFAGGRGFFRQKETRDEHREAALNVLSWSRRMMGQADMLVLDESLYALGSGILQDDELQNLVLEARTKGVHLVLSGRGLPDWLRDQADLITEMTEVKHHFSTGKKALPGIEY